LDPGATQIIYSLSSTHLEMIPVLGKHHTNNTKLSGQPLTKDKLSPPNAITLHNHQQCRVRFIITVIAIVIIIIKVNF